MSKFCAKCGQEVNGEEKFCPACGAQQEDYVVSERNCSENETSSSMDSQGDNQDIHKSNVGKEMKKTEYSFCSSIFMCFKLIYRGRIYTTVTMDSERLEIDIDPKRRNLYPVIRLSDIEGVDVSFAESNYCLYGAVFVAAAGIFEDPLYCIIMALLLFWLGMNRKITIWMKNGREARIFSRSKRKAKQFKKDLLKMLEQGTR